MRAVSRALRRFADRGFCLSAKRREWLVCGHSMLPEGGAAAGLVAALAIFAGDAPSELSGLGRSADPRLARRVMFGPGSLVDRTNVDVLRLVAGRPHWRDEWSPRLRSSHGVAFDLVYLARALSCVPRSMGGAVRVEVGSDPGHRGLKILRVVAPDWRIAIASRYGTCEPPLEVVL